MATIEELNREFDALNGRCRDEAEGLRPAATSSSRPSIVPG